MKTEWTNDKIFHFVATLHYNLQLQLTFYSSASLTSTSHHLLLKKPLQPKRSSSVFTTAIQQQFPSISFPNMHNFRI